MTDYKLVPVELLSELAESLAAELDARYPASVRSYESQDRKYQAEMEPVLTARQIIAVAPAVQGEPVGVMYEDGSLLSKADCGDNFEICCKVQTPLYTAPQPAEQQPPAEGSLTPVPDELFAAEFSAWWEQHGIFCRAGGGDYERTFAFEAWRYLYPRLVKLQKAAAEQQPASRPWSYCPECGSEHVQHHEGEHKQCANCHQEWFSGTDYTDVVRKHLAGKFRDKDAEIERLRSFKSTQPAPDVAALVEALEQIERWDGFPSTDKTWEGSGEPVSYGAAFGSNGERDFMREVARKALAESRANDLTAMDYLNQVREIVGGGDFPDTVEKVKELQSALDAHKASRIAYASEFPLGADGTPDVGNIHENIRLLKKDAEFGRSVLAKREPGKVYGCHCDLEEGMEPDGCVIDSGERHNCIHAKDISVKEQCEYWRVITSDAATQDSKE